jgi:colanic acid/amylovoran biosynthesis glycosyltransferase
VPEPHPYPSLTVWVLVSKFPSLTTTFLLRRIQGLIARGFSVHLLAEELSPKVTPSAEERVILPRVRWAQGEEKFFWFVAAALRQVATSHPFVAWHAWNPLRFRNLAGPRLITAAAALRGLPDPDVVLGCFGPLGELACGLRALGLFHAPVVTSFHGVDAYAKQPHRLRLRYRLLRQRGDLFLPVSRHMAGRLVEAGLDPRRMQVLHTPIRCAQFPWSAPRSIVAGEQIRVLGLGRLSPKKGFIDSLRVIAELKKKGRDVRYDLYGQGGQLPALQRLAGELGISDLVTFHGHLPHAEVLNVYRSSHLFLSTNRMAANGDCEGIPNTIKEAMAVGLPVVATRHSGTPELIVDGVHGLLADEGDVTGLAAACVRMVDDSALAMRCALAARQQVEAHFDESHLNDQLATLLIDQVQRWSQKVRSCAE